MSGAEQDAPSDGAPKRVVVFCHVHYPDVWDEIAQRLAQTLHQPFRLVITTSNAASGIRPPATPWLEDMRVLPVENRGRDVLPFLRALRDEPPFDVGLKLHTKRSVHRLDGDKWRHAIVGSLLPDPDGVRTVVSRLGSNAPLGIVAPTGTLCSVDLWMGRNQTAVERMTARLALDPDAIFATCPFFVSGSMFWFRREALGAFASTDLALLFEAEKGQTDGTAAHAAERLFAAAAEAGEWRTTTAELVGAAGQGDDAEARAAVLAAVDSDTTFLQPSRFIASVSKHAPLAVTLYWSLPDPVRRLIRAALRSVIGKNR